MEKDVQYPEAWTSPYRRVHISDAQRGEPYYCFGCNERMIARLKEDKRRRHFAHKAKVNVVQCSPESALHKAAKRNIQEGFREAVESGGGYSLGYCCSQCGAVRSGNVANPGTDVDREQSVVKGTTSDLVFTNPDGSPRVIVEIEVTHGFEEKTRELYEKSGLPVMTLKVSDWDILPSLRERVIATSTLNIEDTLCASCKRRRAEAEKKRQHRVEEEQRRRAVEELEQERLEEEQRRRALDLMARSYEKEWIDLPGGVSMEAQPVRLKDDEYAIGRLVKVQNPPAEGAWHRWILRKLDNPRFTLPVAIPRTEVAPEKGRSLLDVPVLIRCYNGGERVSNTGQKYTWWHFSVEVYERLGKGLG